MKINIRQNTIEFLMIVIVFLTALFLSAFSFGQTQEMEIGLMTGASNYKGELTKTTLLPIQSTRPVGGIFLRFNHGTRLDWKFNLAYGEISGNDKYSHNENQRLRNLHFKSYLLEYSIQGEYKFLTKTYAEEKENPFLNKKNNFSAYLFGGVGLCMFSPKAKYNGKWYELQRLGTEGQGIVIQSENRVTAGHYSLIQLVIPAGIGMNYSLSSRVKFGFEIGIRKTFTDYLDDVSGKYADTKEIEKSNGEIAGALSNRSAEITGNPKELSQFTAGNSRGDASNKDAYVFSVVNISWLINNLGD